VRISIERRISLKTTDSIRESRSWPEVLKTIRQLGLNDFTSQEEKRVKDWWIIRRKYYLGEISDKEFAEKTKEYTQKIIKEDDGEEFFQTRREVLGLISLALEKT